MAFTVISKPSLFQPIGTGRLNYVFQKTSAPDGYHIEIELNGLTMPVQSYYPDADGYVTCDIATLLRFHVAMSPAVADRFKSTYVKYQEVWTGGSNSQVPLSGDVIYFYPGSNNYLTKRTQFEIRGIENISNGAFAGSLTPWSSVADADGFTSGTTAWGWSNGAPHGGLPRGKVTFAGNADSQILQQTIYLPPGDWHLDLDGICDLTDVAIKVNLYDGVGGYQTILASTPSFGPISYDVDFSTLETFKYIGIQFTNTSGGAFEANIYNASIQRQ